MSGEYENAKEWTEGYKLGNQSGYQDGLEDGRSQGYADAKYRIKKALETVEADSDVWEAVQQLVGEFDE